MDSYDGAYAKLLRASQKYEQLFAYWMEHKADTEAMDVLSVCHFKGYGTKMGSAKGKVNLAYDYLYRIGTEKSYEMALASLKVLIKQYLNSPYKKKGKA